MSETILITGGAGFIGSHVAAALVGRGYQVVILDDLSGGFRENVPPAWNQVFDVGADTPYTVNELAAERYGGAEPVNLGSSFEISIRELAETIQRLTGYAGRITWDTTKPNGQPRRKLDTARAERWFGFRAVTPFALGLQRTVAWYSDVLARVLVFRETDALYAG